MRGRLAIKFIYMNYNQKTTLFFDIETVPTVAKYADLSAPMQEAWLKKCKSLRKDDPEASPEDLWSQAGLSAEFSKVVCISLGFYREQGDFDIISCYGDDEKKLLSEFSERLNQFRQKRNQLTLSGHNILEFDIPFLFRRMLLLQMEIPTELNISEVKPWEQKDRYIDTLKTWSMGVWGSRISLNTLCAVIGIPSPKEELSGDKVGKAYWEESRLEDIRRYCEQDVLAQARVVRHLCGEDPMGIELQDSPKLFD